MVPHLISASRRCASAALFSAGVTLLCTLISCSRTASDDAATGRTEATPDGTGAAARIVSLSPSVTEILFALDLGPRVKGVTRYCDYPPAALEKPKVGGYYDANLEAVTALQPDLVITLREQEKVVNQLGQLGVDVLTVQHDTIPQILRSIETIGTRCGKASEAGALVADLRTRMEAIRGKTAELPRPRVLVCIGRTVGTGSLQDLYIAGQDGFFSTVIEMAGGVNAYPGTAVTFPLVSREGLLAMKPDVVFDLVAGLPDMKLTREEVLRDWEFFPDLPAVANERVYILGGDYVTIPGPRFILLLEAMARRLHPEVDWQ